ncbi:MAG: hypothetical protein ACI8Y4_002700 [Candidatus Poriferisodalaceae bacterium]|jgi:hypothetical protein
MSLLTPRRVAAERLLVVSIIVVPGGRDSDWPDLERFADALSALEGVPCHLVEHAASVVGELVVRLGGNPVDAPEAVVCDVLTSRDQTPSVGAARTVVPSRFLATFCGVALPIVVRPPSSQRPAVMSADDLDRSSHVVAVVGEKRGAALSRSLMAAGVTAEQVDSFHGALAARATIVVDTRPKGTDIDVVASAMANEMAIVVPDDSGAPLDLVRHESTGLVAPVSMLAAAVTRLLTDDALRNRVVWEAAMLERESSWASVARCVLATPGRVHGGAAAALDPVGQVARGVRWRRRVGHVGHVEQCSVMLGDVADAEEWGRLREADLAVVIGGSGVVSPPTRGRVVIAGCGVMRAVSLVRSADRVVAGAGADKTLVELAQSLDLVGVRVGGVGLGVQR